MKTTNIKKGFTLLELTVAIGVLVVILSISIMSSSTFILRGHINTTKQEIIHTLHKAQMNSIYKLNDSEWGVHFVIDNGSGISEFTFFQGTTYASRDTSFDETHEIPTTVVIDSISLTGGGNDVIFTKKTGETSYSGNIIIENSQKQYKITINTLGHVDI